MKAGIDELLAALDTHKTWGRWMDKALDKALRMGADLQTALTAALAELEEAKAEARTVRLDFSMLVVDSRGCWMSSRHC